MGVVTVVGSGHSSRPLLYSRSNQCYYYNMKNHSISINTWSVVKIILVLIGFYLAYVLRDLLLISLAGIVIASAVEPMVKWFMQFKMNRLVSVLIIYIGLGAIAISSFFFLFTPLLHEVSDFLTVLPDYLSSAELWKPFQSLGFFDSAPAAVQNISSDLSIREIATNLNKTASDAGSVWGTFSAIFGGVFGFVIMFVLSFYLAVQEKGIENFLISVSPAKQKDYIVGLWNRAEVKIGLWMQGQIVLILVITVLVYLALLLLQVRSPLLLALVAGFFELVPVFGPIIAAVPAVVISFVDGGVTQALLVTGAYVIIQQFENHLIYPVVVKKVVGVSPIMVILALIAGAKIAGFLGVLLSVPVAAVLIELFKDISQGKKIPSSH